MGSAQLEASTAPVGLLPACISVMQAPSSSQPVLPAAPFALPAADCCAGGECTAEQGSHPGRRRLCLPACCSHMHAATAARPG